MSREVAPPYQIPASVGGRRLTLDPIRTLTLPIEVREVESTIPAGFQTEWGTVDVDGDELWIGAGAGFGSAWSTISFRGKCYAISGAQIVEAFLAALDEADAGGSESPSPAPEG